MVVAEVAEGEAVQVVLVGGVAEGAEIGVMRGFDAHASARLHQTVELFHGANDVGEMFDDVDGAQAVKGAVGERVGEVVKFADHVGGTGGVEVDAEGARVLANAAADVESSRKQYSLYNSEPRAACQGKDTMNDVMRFAAFALALCFAAAGQAASPIIDNERVTVWDGTSAVPHPAHDFVTVYLTAGKAHKRGDAFFTAKGAAAGGEEGAHTIVIELKDHAVTPLENKTGYPNAFPRPHVKKLYDSDRITLWSYAWNPGEPTPMHYHDKDVVVVYMEDTALKSTAPDGKSTINEYKAGQTKFNLRDRTHTELLIRGTGSAVMTELK
jgi:hypothetical protein